MVDTTLHIPTKRRRTKQGRHAHHFQGGSHQIAFKDKKKTSAQKHWIARQKNDPYVQLAIQEGWRCRSAFKLIELDKILHLISSHTRAIDLGAAPGGWTQVLMRKKVDYVVGIDLLPVDPQSDVTFIQGDFRQQETRDKLHKICQPPPNLVISDMAPNTTGHHQTDHLRIMSLAEEALDFAVKTLVPGGNFITKIFQGGSEAPIYEKIKKYFKKFRLIKPDACRKESSEIYLAGLHFCLLKDNNRISHD